MWLVTKLGFVSIVAHTNKKDMLLRFRAKVDAEAYKKHVKEMGWKTGRLAIQHTPKADYPFRFRLPVIHFPDFLADLAATVDYANFKKATTKPGTIRGEAYMRVWGALQLLTTANADIDKPRKVFSASDAFDFTGLTPTGRKPSEPRFQNIPIPGDLRDKSDPRCTCSVNPLMCVIHGHLEG